MKLPLGSVVKERTCLVRSLVNWAVAPPIAEPAESVTVPEIWPVTLCPETLDDATNQVDNHIATVRMLFTHSSNKMARCCTPIGRKHISCENQKSSAMLLWSGAPNRRHPQQSGRRG
jgi:hypothetical protein